MLNTVIALTALAGAQASSEPIFIPFRVAENGIIVDVEVNGRKISAMFDTGFTGALTLNDSIDIGKPTGEGRVRDFVGESTVKTVAIKSFALGGHKLNVPDMDAMEIDGFDDSWSYGMHIDGIMGMEPLSGRIFEINMEKKGFYLYPNTYDITKRVPDKKRTFLSRMLPIGNNAIEMTVKTADGKSMHLALDTGNSFFATTHSDVLERIGVWKQGTKPKFMRSSFIASGAVDSYDFEMENVTIYGVPVPKSQWSIINLPSSSSEHDGTVGFQFLKNFNITIDLSRRAVWLENFTGKVADEEPASPGFQAFYIESMKKMVVVRVAEGGPAATAGIKRGDHVLAIDGKLISRMGPRVFERLIEGPVDKTVNVQVSRGGVLKTFTVGRQFLVNKPMKG